MGAWGYGYRDNDNYFNMAGDFVTPLIDGLAGMSAKDDTQDLRVRLMWTANVLRHTDEEVYLSTQEVAVLRDVIGLVREKATLEVESWREPDEYLATVEEELQGVEHWLGNFRETVFLEDRIGPLLAAINRQDEDVE
jgi:hypothetical protein